MIDFGSYVKKITSATPLGLVIINFELILDYLNAAKTSSNDEEFKLNMNGAHNFLKELIASLDMDIDLSKQLLELYIYVNKLVLIAAGKKDTTMIDAAHSILENLLSAFREIKEDVTEKAVMEDAPRVFAGLTYDSNGNLSEYSDINIKDYKA